MNNSAKRMRCGGTLEGPADELSSLPKSFSARPSRSNDYDDYSELIRAASARSLDNRIEMDMILQKQDRSRQSSIDTTIVGLNNKGLPKCCSVGMSKIDEDGPCEFDEKEGFNMKPEPLYPRSKSYAVNKRNLWL